jgi:hypothetical protein
MKMPAMTGWLWLKEGVGLFRKQPAALMTLLFANILFVIAIGFVPYLGSLLAVVLIPSFSMAFMQACMMIDSGKRVTPRVLLTGFRKPGVAALCKVGLIYLAISIAVPVLMKMVLDPALLQQLGKPLDPEKVPAVRASDIVALLSIFLFELAALMALCFAAPLTYWQKMSVGKATFYSFFAVLKSLRVFVVLLLAWFGIFFAIWMVLMMVFGGAKLGQMMTMWLGFLFILLLQCAMYVGYRQIFGKPEDPAAQAA